MAHINRRIEFVEGFKNFLLGRGLIPEKKVPYFLNWLRKYAQFHGIDDGSASIVVPASDLSSYLDYLSKNYETWQVDQANEALRLWEYYQSVKNSPSQFTKGASSDDQWREVAGNMIRALRLRHRA